MPKPVIALICLFVLTLAISHSQAAADVVRYIDHEGRTHYVEGADKVPRQFRDQLKDQKPLPRINRSRNVLFKPSKNTRYNSSKSKVEIFVTSWCPHCRSLEEFLNKHRVRYTKYDIDRNSTGRKIHQQLGGGGVPVTRIGSKVVRGYSPSKLGAALGIE